MGVIPTEKQVQEAQNEAVLLAARTIGSEEELSVALASTAEALTIKTSEELEASTDLLTTVKSRQKVLTDLRQSITRPMDAARTQVMKLFQPVTDRLVAAETTIKAAVLTYTQEQARLQRAEQARLDEDARRERLRLEKLADRQREAGRDERAEATEGRAAVVEAPTVAPAKVPTGAVHVRTTWHVEVTDLAALVKACAEGRVPLELIQPDMANLNAQVRTHKDRLAIPGVKAVSEEGVAARRA